MCRRRNEIDCLFCDKYKTSSCQYGGMGSFCVTLICQMGFFGDADNFVDRDLIVGGDVLIWDVTFQLVADGAERMRISKVM